MYFLAILLLVGGPLMLIAIAVAGQSFSRGRVDTREEWKWVRLTWAASLVVGGAVAWIVYLSLDLGRGTMLVPAVLGLFLVLGVGLAETVVRPRRPTGPRTASLAPRRVVDYLPRNLAIAVGGITVLHLATLALTTATASADDMRRAGRQIAADCGDMSSAAGPYPGSFYSGPLMLLLVIIGLASVATLTAVVRRPRGFAPDDLGDDVLRQRSTTRVLAAAGAAVAATHAGIALFGGDALLRADCQGGWMIPVGWVLLASAPAALLLLGWFLGRIAVPGTLAVLSSGQAVETR